MYVYAYWSNQNGKYARNDENIGKYTMKSNEIDKLSVLLTWYDELNILQFLILILINSISFSLLSTQRHYHADLTSLLRH